MKVKFCGITRAEDAREAVRLGAWAIGLNHWS
ncbi:MAG: N-(5'-phosphoribosyl)anthranilate isomerase, partial [Solirubrobacterales bacterium]